MTPIDEAIKEFVKDRVGGVIVNGEDGEIFYQDSRIVLSSKGVETWNRKRPMMNERKTWEFTDMDAGKYYRVETATVNTSKLDYQCHLFTDVSDYATLFQDISDYSKWISDMNDFQKNILSKLSQEYDSFLPELTDFCRATDSILYVEQKGSGYIRKSSYGTRLHRCRIKASKELEDLIQTSVSVYLMGITAFYPSRHRIRDMPFSCAEDQSSMKSIFVMLLYIMSFVFT